MDVTKVEYHQAIVKMPTSEIISLDSDTSDSELASAIAMAQQRGPAKLEVEDGPPTLESGDEVFEEEESDDDGGSWDGEGNSHYDHNLEELGDAVVGGVDSVTLEEAVRYRQLLRDIGPAEFCAQTVENGSITAKKLLTAFGMRPPLSLEGSPDDAYYGLLSVAISRELTKRAKLRKYNTIDDAVALMKTARNIMVITGAGISTSLGIPDFRSKDIGLYAKLEHLDLNDPQEVFDISVFRRDPRIFYSVAKDIIPSTDRTTPTHKFIHLLQSKGKLLTNYSQNIDNIEAVAGILPEKLIQCHGSFATASCIDCGYQAPGETIFGDVRAGLIPKCPRCQAKSKALPGHMKRKRSAQSQDRKRRRGHFGDTSDEDDDDSYDNPNKPAKGVMKPDITFFGEALPDRFSERLTGHDRDKVDLVIVIGTSLRVAPVSEVVPYLPPHIPQVCIVREPINHVNFDVDMLGDCDTVVAELCRRAGKGWELEHEMIPEGQKVDVTLDEGYNSRWSFKVRK